MCSIVRIIIAKENSTYYLWVTALLVSGRTVRTFKDPQKFTKFQMAQNKIGSVSTLAMKSYKNVQTMSRWEYCAPKFKNKERFQNIRMSGDTKLKMIIKGIGIQHVR